MSLQDEDRGHESQPSRESADGIDHRSKLGRRCHFDDREVLKVVLLAEVTSHDRRANVGPLAGVQLARDVVHARYDRRPASNM